VLRDSRRKERPTEQLINIGEKKTFKNK